MKIDNTSSLSQLIQTEQGKQTGKSRASTPAQDTAKAATPAAVTHLSQLAQDDSMDIDQARVAEISQAIREGRLEINPEKVADGLLASVKAMLNEEG